MTGLKSRADRPTGEVLGVRVSLLDMDATVKAVDELVAAAEPALVATADASGLVIAGEDERLRRAYGTAALVTADSNGVVWALRRAGHRVSRVSGVDLMDRLCRLSAEKGQRIFLLGAAPGVADQAAERLRLRHPGVNIVGTRHGYFPSDDDPLVAAEIAQAKPDLLFVAMGIPRQEVFITSTLAIHGAKVSMGVGGSFDVFSGRARRAPRLVQALKLEWLWRLILNPKKASKVMLLPRFVWLVLRQGR
jgi:N-acetylglucosaminyldiphosphoundecaprenol N-acetyl-beta-D-mannosaminyltransferase